MPPESMNVTGSSRVSLESVDRCSTMYGDLVSQRMGSGCIVKKANQMCAKAAILKRGLHSSRLDLQVVPCASTAMKAQWCNKATGLSRLIISPFKSVTLSQKMCSSFGINVIIDMAYSFHILQLILMMLLSIDKNIYHKNNYSYY